MHPRPRAIHAPPPTIINFYCLKFRCKALHPKALNLELWCSISVRGLRGQGLAGFCLLLLFLLGFKV